MKRPRWIHIAALVLFALLLGGCINIQQEYWLYENGSAKVSMDIGMSQALLSMGAASGSDTTTNPFETLKPNLMPAIPISKMSRSASIRIMICSTSRSPLKYPTLKSFWQTKPRKTANLTSPSPIRRTTASSSSRLPNSIPAARPAVWTWGRWAKFSRICTGR